ncbi:hypothetical protein [Proteiniclasticum ruminis]|uniref:hypothetical protein n=1 Tax=Proteiniclasticum ruminis TaxID=398199 RepID=UPI0028AD2061|nr:hypothetical protein [Proteiniclasticum ruminis]
MIMRVASISEEQFSKCKKYKLWGSERPTIMKWTEGELILFKTKDRIMGLAEVIGKPFEDNLLIWEGGLYPYRVPIVIIKEYNSFIGDKLYQDFKDIMIKEYGSYYGWVILNKHPLKESIVNMISKYNT